jgi:hydroxyacylglutathione hydrolase
MPSLEIIAVPVLSDNYAWLVFDPKTEEVAVVDPGEAEPVLAAAEASGWTVSQVWLTHWHPDHTGGVAKMKASGATVTGPAEARRVCTVDTEIGEGDVVRIGSHTGHVLATPGHTDGHVSLHFAEDEAVFSGDTLFAMGCGRLLEGTPEQMHASLARFAAMPDATRVYAGHEYTQTNARFARVAEPDNQAIEARARAVDAARAAGEPTLPSSVGEERATNPFLRADSVEQLARLRADKDGFRG